MGRPNGRPNLQIDIAALPLPKSSPMSAQLTLIKRKLLEGKIEIAIKADDKVWSFRQVFQAWEKDPEFALWWQQQLAAIRYPAIFWECPPLRKQEIGRPFRAVWIRSPRLGRIEPNGSAFAEHWEPRERTRVVSFTNLSKDARLVVPMPGSGGEEYAHLLDFARKAPESQAVALWARVAREMGLRLNNNPCWLSTAGLGVSWLHVRLDNRPKYYRHLAYRNGAMIRRKDL